MRASEDRQVPRGRAMLNCNTARNGAESTDNLVLDFKLQASSLTPSSSGPVTYAMSFLQNARDTTIHFQDTVLTAVGGDQQINGPVTIAGPQHIAGSQHIHQAAPLKGALLSPQLVRLTV